MKYGYARVSMRDQNLDLQIHALQREGCEIIFTEKISSRKVYRKELDRLLLEVKKEDMIVIWKLDRLGRSLKELLKILLRLEKAFVQLKSINESIDTTSVQGRLFFHIVAAFAEYERGVIKERTLEGLAAAREKGRRAGRPKGLNTNAQVTAALVDNLYTIQRLSTREICIQANITRSTLYRYLKYRKVKLRVDS